MSDLTGRRAIVTGASGTFGRLLCHTLTAAGARVVGIDLHGGEVDGVTVLSCDLTDTAAAAAAVESAAQLLGGLDLLINNAGVGGPAPAEFAPGAAARQQIEVNLVAAWAVTAAAVPALEASRGRVIFVASRMAVLPLPLAAAYGVSKRALVAYADALRLEVGTHIGVSVVYPSMVASPIHDASAEAGLSLQGVSRLEPVEGVIAAILRAATARKAPSNVATTRRGRFEMAIARHLPSVAGLMVRRTIATRIAAGDLDRAPLAAGMVRRHGRTPAA
ncbi:NAD(P)-dependent dehydrogenase (short-subunit alcohol dehydrogenase family) [Allocatelliglobosispora scoriae]|uniref:NAD(P)-dependent dehydrogenase (Short-subunit alcohol dehydrogenase family) n=1 Tax=Allocatelliglobosispora scoriae TaxID=643052 RepID=A0A841BIA1_9ACTN|nr:SDR family NAD(P)-dependent oxidoreductase [Allocatelliglobosispora scoriae]MBB5868847.1 NAD(P)-dependent dehydrogenase (short-subunit alcohol dehydrogenase family) [Allocatelliglobosispora scoriae]